MSELLNNCYDQKIYVYSKFFEINNSKIEKFGDTIITNPPITDPPITDPSITDPPITDNLNVSTQVKVLINKIANPKIALLVSQINDKALDDPGARAVEEAARAKAEEENRARAIEEAARAKAEEENRTRAIEEAARLSEIARMTVIPVLTYPPTSLSIATNLITSNSVITISQLNTAIDEISKLLINNQSITPSLYNTLIIGLENIIIKSYKDDFSSNKIVSESINSTIMVQLLQGISYIVLSNYKPLYNQLLKLLNITIPTVNNQFNNLQSTINSKMNDYDYKYNIDNQGALLQLLSNVIYNDQAIPFLFVNILVKLLGSQLVNITKNKLDNINLQTAPLNQKIAELNISNKLLPIVNLTQMIKIYLENMEADYIDINTKLNKLLITNPLRGEIIVQTDTKISDIDNLTSSSIATLLIPKNSNITVTDFTSSLDKLKVLLNNNNIINPELYKMLLFGIKNIFDPVLDGSFDDDNSFLSIPESIPSFIIIQILHIFSYYLRSDYNKFYNKLYNQLLNFLNIKIPSVNTNFIDLINLFKKNITELELDSDFDINKEASLLQLISVLLNYKKKIPAILIGLIINIKILQKIGMIGYTIHNDGDKLLMCDMGKITSIYKQIQDSIKNNELIPVIIIKQMIECNISNIKPKYTEIYSQFDKLILNNPSITYAYVLSNVKESKEITNSKKPFFTLPVIIAIIFIVLIIFILVILKIMNII